MDGYGYTQPEYAPAEEYEAPVYEPPPPVYEPPPPVDPRAGYNYDAQGGYGAGYPPPYEPQPGYYPPAYQASNYDTQGNYGTGYGPVQAPPLYETFEDGDVSWAGRYLRNGFLRGSTTPNEGSWPVQPNVPNTARSFPYIPDDVWRPEGDLQQPSVAIPPSPFPDDIHDYYEDEDLDEY